MYGDFVDSYLEYLKVLRDRIDVLIDERLAENAALMSKATNSDLRLDP